MVSRPKGGLLGAAFIEHSLAELNEQAVRKLGMAGGLPAVSVVVIAAYTPVAANWLDRFYGRLH